MSEAIRKAIDLKDQRREFEKDAEAYGFDVTRLYCVAPEPWSEYASEATGHRWAGRLAAIAQVNGA